MATLPIRSLSFVLTTFLIGILGTVACAQDLAPEDLADKAARLGTIRVIVTLVSGFVPEPDLPTLAHVQRQRQAFAGVRAALSSALAGTRSRVVRAPATLPVVTLEVDAQAITVLRALPGIVADIVEDEFLRRSLTQSVPLVGAPSTWALGYDGSGTIVAILDDGVESTHPFLVGKVVREACFSSNMSPFLSSLCPGGIEFSEAPGSAAPCNLDCAHGTHVAGIAAGGDGSAGSGVAQGAAIWAIQVFSRLDDFGLGICFPEPSPCAVALLSDVIEALNYLYTHRTSVPGMVVAAANMSLGGPAAGTTTCDGNPAKPAIDQLRAGRIASVIAAGDEGYTNAVSPPGCISTAVSVGSTGDLPGNQNTVSFFSNMAPFVSLLAPGEDIVSSVPPNGFTSLDGTSMATPHVAGAFAILRQFAPLAPVTDILNALRASGEPVTDDRPLLCFNTFSCPVATVPRIRILEALNLLRPDLVTTVVTASALVGAGQAVAVANTVKNQSTVGFAGPFDVGLYLSTDNVIDPLTDQLLTTRSVAGLGPNAISAATTTVTIPDSLVPGTYFIGVFADPADAVIETSELNNARASSAITVIAPDVATTVTTGPAVAAPGAVVTITNTVKNNTAAPVSPFTAGFYLSTDDVLDLGDVLLGTRPVPALAANAVSTAATPVTVPANTVPGIYRIIVRADEGQAFTESDEANNVRATAPIVIGPDLVVTAVTLPAKAQAGQVITLNGTVQNVGSALLPAQTSTLAFYLSTDNVFDGLDVLLGTRTVPGLAAGAMSPGATSLTFPAVPIGTYFVIARADNGGVIVEAREDNNTRTAVATILVGPDVAVSVATGPAGAAPGLPVTIANTVVNNGPGPVSFTVGFYLSTDDVFDGADVALGSRSVTMLAAGGSSAAATVLTIPANTGPGVYRILVRADNGGTLTEANEGNNVKATGPITVALPDLVVTAVTAPAIATAGATISTSHTVRNAILAIGAAPASVSRFYLSTDDTLGGGDVDLGTANVPALGPGAMATVAKSVTIPLGTAVGAYFIIARADDANAIAETNDGNNARATAKPVIVGPDLVVSAVTAPAKAQAGQVIAVNGTVQNVGSGLLPAQTSTLAFYLSTDTVLDGGDVPLGTRLVPGLGAGTTSAGATSVTIPGNTSVGTYFVIARADDLGVIAEAREGNNTRATAVPIIVGPDIAVTVVSGPAGGAPGLPISIPNTVVNNGPLAVSFSVAFYLSTNDTFENGVDVALGTRTVTNLAAGGSSAVTTVLTLPANTAAGSYRVLVRADDPNTLNEANEGNNLKASGPILVTLPDLTVTALSMPLVVIAGQSVTISNTVRNNNNAVNPGAAPAFTVGLYLSTDGTIDPASDLLLASRHVSGLAPGASSAAATVTPVPNTPGDFFVGAVADPGNAVSESDETNNTASTAAVAIVPEMRRNAAGSVNATVNITLSGCLNPINNGSFSAPAVVKITTQTGASWSGTTQFTSLTSGAGVTTTFSGVVQTNGATTGTFTFSVTNGTKGSGTFSGTATSSAGGSPGTFNATLTGNFTTGELCAVSGTLSQP